MIRSTILLLLSFAATLGTPLHAQGPGNGDDKGNGKGKPKEPPAAKVDFRTQVWPILEQRCIKCHSTAKPDENGRLKRPKGGVTFDTKDGILASKKGKVVVAGKPDSSMMVESISLPADDEDRMPPAKEGEPLAKEQIALIRRWIEEGAEFGTWKGKDKEKDKADGADGGKTDGGRGSGTKGSGDKGTGATEHGGKGHGKDAHEELLQRLGAGLAPAGDEALAAAARAHAFVEPLTAQSPLLAVSFFGHEQEVGVATLRALQPLREHVTELCLAHTSVGDDACRELATWPRLCKLDLRGTKVGDDGVRALAALPELRSLNLFGTAAGDAGVAALQACTHLEHLYVYATPVTAQAVVALRERLPEARIVVAADLPDPAAQPARPTRRR